MQYKTGKLTDKIKPYSKARSRPNARNSAIDVKKQARLYRENMQRKHGSKPFNVSLFPETRGDSHANTVREHFTVGGAPMQGVTIKDVDPKEWK